MSNNRANSEVEGSTRPEGSGPASTCNPLLVAGHEAFQQRVVEPMQIADGIGHAKQRFQVHVQRGVAERGNIDQRRIADGPTAEPEPD